MKIIKVGIMPRDHFQKRLIEIASGRYIPKKNEPKIWFSSIKLLGEVIMQCVRWLRIFKKGQINCWMYGNRNQVSFINEQFGLYS